MNNKLRELTNEGLAACFISPDEMDRNFENANVVDGLFAIARALDRIATNMGDLRTDHPLMGETLYGISTGLENIAEAIADHKK